MEEMNGSVKTSILQAVIGDSGSKKKLIIVSIVSVVALLLIIGGWIFGYDKYRDNQEIKIHNEFSIRYALCNLDCPFVSEKIDYENGVGNLGIEKTAGSGGTSGRKVSGF